MVAVAHASLGSLACRAVPTSSWWARASWARRAPTTWPSPACACGSVTAPTSPPGSSGACEGNVLAWDKELERELPLALRSRRPVGSTSPRARRRLRVRPQGQRRRRRDRGGAGRVGRARPRARRPRRARARCWTPTRCAARSRTPRTTCPGGVLYPGDAQLEPRLATAALVRAAVAAGAELSLDTADRTRSCASRPAAPSASQTATELITADAVVVRRRRVDAGPARDRAGLHVPVTPRKGQIVVLERSPVRVPPQAERGRLRRRRRGRRRRRAGRSRWSSSRRRPARRCSAPAASTSASTARSTSPSPARSPAAPPASSRSSATPARCASTPGCAR